MAVSEHNITLPLRDLGIDSRKVQRQHGNALKILYQIQNDIIERSGLNSLPFDEMPAVLARIAPAVGAARHAYEDLMNIQEKREQIG